MSTQRTTMEVRRDTFSRCFSAIAILGIVIMVFGTATFYGCLGGDSGSTSPTATPTDTPTPTPTPTMTPTPTATPTPTEEPGWRTEEMVTTAADYSLDEVKLDLEANENGDLVLAYIKDFNKMYYTVKPKGGSWSTPALVPGTENNIEGRRFYIQTSIDNNMDAHFVWTGPGVPWRYCFYNRYDATSQSWVYPNGIDVIWGNDYTLAPDIATTPADTRRYMAAQSGWGIGFNWDLGDGLQTEMNYPIVNENGEPKRPRLAITPDGIVHMIFFDYMGPSGTDQPQIGYATFDPSTQAWSEFSAPAPVPYGGYPGGPAIAAGPDNSVHICWYNWHEGNEYDELMYATKNPQGEWSSTLVWSDNGLIREPFEAEFPDIKVNSDGVVMILAKAQNSWEEVIYYFVLKPGESWTSPTKIPVSSEKQFTPSLAVDGAKFVMSWQDSRGPIYTMEYVP